MQFLNLSLVKSYWIITLNLLQAKTENVTNESQFVFRIWIWAIIYDINFLVKSFRQL